jgi:hypothetical protein
MTTGHIGLTLDATPDEVNALVQAMVRAGEIERRGPSLYSRPAASVMSADIADVEPKKSGEAPAAPAKVPASVSRAELDEMYRRRASEEGSVGDKLVSR